MEENKGKIVGNYKLNEELGQGAYGKVFLCRIREEQSIDPLVRERMRIGRKIACKMISVKRIHSRVRKYLLQEINLMLNLRHENILNCLEVTKSSNNIYLFIELCNGGDLKRLLKAKGGRVDEKLAFTIALQIAKGLKYLNVQEVIHRDLKLDNIMINFPNQKESKRVKQKFLEEFDPSNEDIEVIIGDLGFARSLAAGDLTTSY